MWPYGHAQIVQDDARLGDRVVKVATLGEVAPHVGQGGEDQPGQDGPGRGQGQVERAPPPERRKRRAAHERRVVEQHDQRCHRTDFLGADAEGAGHHRSHVPAPVAVVFEAADGAVQGEQEEQAHQRLGSLHDVGHALGLHRVGEPNESGRQRQPGRPLAVALAEASAGQGATHDPEQHERGSDVNRQVDGMEALRAAAEPRHVDGKREAQHRSAHHRAALAAGVGALGVAEQAERHRLGQRPQLANVGIVANRLLGIEAAEQIAEAVRVRTQCDGDDEGGGDADLAGGVDGSNVPP
jgi:hypothetical protein